MEPGHRHDTVGGPVFRQDGNKHRKSPCSIGHGCYRLTHDKVGVSDIHPVQSIQLRTGFMVGYCHFIRDNVDMDASGEYWVDIVRRESRKPHCKQRIRKEAFDALVELGVVSIIEATYGDQVGMSDVRECVVPLDLLDTGEVQINSARRSRNWRRTIKRRARVRIKLKRELGRPNKWCRVTADLSTPASLRAGFVVDAIKEALASNPLRVNGFKSVFVKSPRLEVLSKHYTFMELGTRALVFSDDAALSLRCRDGMLWLNLDITACDASNSKHVFSAIRRLCPPGWLPHIDRAIDQCRADAVIGVGTGKIILRPVDVFEYSGSVLTTILNTIASLCITGQLLSGHSESLTREEARLRVEAILLECGWKCTAEWCSVFEELQFLKTSPIRTVNSDVRATLNLGVIIRAMGRTDGDYPGRGALLPRIEAFNRVWVSGLVHAGTYGLTRALRARWPHTRGKLPSYGSNAIDYLQGDSGYLDDVPLFEPSLCARYKLDLAHLEELYELVRFANVGDLLTCHAADACLRVDYGLRSPC